MNETGKKDFLKGMAYDLLQAGDRQVPGAEELGNQILATIRQQKGLAYVTAYAGLQYAYDQLRAESSFVQTRPDHTLAELVSRQLKQGPTQV